MQYRLDPQRLIWREVDGEVIAVDLAGATYLAANETARVLWPLLVRGAAEEELVAAILAEFEASEDEVRRDVSSFCAELRDQGFLGADAG